MIRRRCGDYNRLGFAVQLCYVRFPDRLLAVSEPPYAPILAMAAAQLFGSLDQPWKPGYLRSAYAAICYHRFKPPNQTDDIFLAQILGHKLLGPNASLSVGQSYKDFYIRNT